MKSALILAAISLSLAACATQPTAAPARKMEPQTRIPAMAPLPPFIPNQNLAYDCTATLQRTVATNERLELKYQSVFKLFNKKGSDYKFDIGDKEMQWKLVSGDEKKQPVNGDTKGQRIGIDFRKTGKGFAPRLRIWSTLVSEDGTKDINAYTAREAKSELGTTFTANLIYEERNNWSKGEPKDSALAMNSTSLEVSCTRTE